MPGETETLKSVGVIGKKKQDQFGLTIFSRKPSYSFTSADVSYWLYALPHLGQAHLNPLGPGLRDALDLPITQWNSILYASQKLSI